MTPGRHCLPGSARRARRKRGIGLDRARVWEQDSLDVTVPTDRKGGSMRRKSMKRGNSKRLFKKAAGYSKRNSPYYNMSARGGIRL